MICMWKKSIYKNKKANLKDAASYYYAKLKREAMYANKAIDDIGFAAYDINARMKAGSQRAFGKKRKGF